VHVVISSLKKSLDEMSKVPDLEPKILADLYKSQKLETYIKAPMMPPVEPIDPDPNERPLKYPDENKWIWVLFENLKKDLFDSIKPLNDFLTIFD
jgi:dynein heavy chain